jgi:signal transduction histidine kinase
MVPFDAATLFTYNTTTKKLEGKSSLDGKLDLLNFVTRGSGKARLGWAVPDKKPILVVPNSLEGLSDTLSQYQSLLSAPLLSGEDVIGVLNLGCRRAGAFDENDVQLIMVVAGLFGASAERQHFLAREIMKNQALASARLDVGKDGQGGVVSNRLALAAELVASVHHQINNPLAVIVGNVQCLLVEKRDLDEKALARLKVIEKAALKVSKVNRNLLTVGNLARDQLDGDTQESGTAPASSRGTGW